MRSRWEECPENRVCEIESLHRARACTRQYSAIGLLDSGVPAKGKENGGQYVQIRRHLPRTAEEAAHPAAKTCPHLAHVRCMEEIRRAKSRRFNEQHAVAFSQAQRKVMAVQPTICSPGRGSEKGNVSTTQRARRFLGCFGICRHLLSIERHSNAFTDFWSRLCLRTAMAHQMMRLSRLCRDPCLVVLRSQTMRSFSPVQGGQVCRSS